MHKHVEGKHRVETITDALSRREIQYGVKGGRFGFHRCPYLTVQLRLGEDRQFALFGSRSIEDGVDQ